MNDLLRDKVAGMLQPVLRAWADQSGLEEAAYNECPTVKELSNFVAKTVLECDEIAAALALKADYDAVRLGHKTTGMKAVPGYNKSPHGG